MEVREYFSAPDREHWLKEIGKSDWGAGAYLSRTLRDGNFKELFGGSADVLLLTEGGELIAYCTFAEQDDIRPTELTPWAGFVYTFPRFRGRRYAGRLLARAEERAAAAGFDCLYLSTNHVGLYEKYGYRPWTVLKDVDGRDSGVYRKKLA